MNAVLRVLRAIREALSKPLYLLLFLASSAAMFFVAIWISNFGLLGEILYSPKLDALEKIYFLGGSVYLLRTNFSPLGSLMVVVNSLLFGINVAFLSYAFKKRLYEARAVGASFGATISGLIGVGCASCGSVALSIMGISAGSLAALPFGGQEFSFLGAGLLLYSLFMTYKKIPSSVCRR